MAGYSGTPLAQKLGIKPGSIVVVLNQPANYRKLLGKGARGVEFSDFVRPDCSFVHLFSTHRSELKQNLRLLHSNIADAGVIWVSWPKKSSKISSDVTEDVIREVALPLGLVDIKVCAVDETWSGLKLMIRKINRRIPSP